MDAFEKHFKYYFPHEKKSFGCIATKNDIRNFWEKSAKQCKLTHDDIFEIGRADGVKQNAAEIDHLKTIIENLEMSVASFTDSNVDLVARERERIVGMIREWAECQDRSALWVDCYKLVADRIEKDSN